MFQNQRSALIIRRRRSTALVLLLALLATAAIAPAALAQGGRQASNQVLSTLHGPREMADASHHNSAAQQVGEPEINILGNGQAIANGDTTPSADDGTDFGEVALGQEAEHTFTISNTGAMSLTLTGTPAISLTSAITTPFTVAITPTTSITTTESTTFTLRFAPTSVGVFTVTVSIPNNDTDENPYTFAVQGTGAILPGYGSTPAPGSPINVGSTPIGIPVSTTLLISETGGVTLTVTSHSLSGPNAADFSVSPAELSIVDGAPAQTLTITCKPSGMGERTATLTVNHNGPDSPATYPLSCTATEAKLYIPIILQATAVITPALERR